MTKKSLLEKLGLFERIDSDNSESTVEVINDEFSFSNLNDYSEEDEEIDEVDESINENDLFERLERMSQMEPEASEPKEFKEEEKNPIEDKLNVLIGAYEKNKMLSIEEIYRNARLSGDMKKTIFMVDVFLKALPENLPIDIKRESVSNILNVSSIKLEELLTDAYQRMDALNTVLENTVQTTEEIVGRNEASIRELENRIEDLKKVSETRRKFQEDQNTMIEYEVQKIINIVEFIKPKK